MEYYIDGFNCTLKFEVESRHWYGFAVRDSILELGDINNGDIVLGQGKHLKDCQAELKKGIKEYWDNSITQGVYYEV